MRFSQRAAMGQPNAIVVCDGARRMSRLSRRCEPRTGGKLRRERKGTAAAATATAATAKTSASNPRRGEDVEDHPV